MPTIATEVKKDFEKKLETYINAAYMFELIGDTELYNLSIKKAAGCKAMIESGLLG